MTRLLVGAYSDNQGSDGPQEFSAWLGATQDLDSIFTGQANASDYETSVNYAIGVQNWSGAKHVSLPLLYSGGPTLAQAGSGSMDSEWTSAIQSVLSALPNQAIIYLRTAWEFNGNYELWASPPGNEGIFVTAWQRFAGIARSLDTKNQFRLVWCFNVGQNNPGPSYPGNAYVDVIGIDIYWQPGQPTDFPSWMLNVQYGLSYLASLGQQYGKPICIPELGLGSNGLAQSTTDLFTWAQANNMAYMNLWDSNLAYGPGGQLSQNQYPATGAAFRTAALAVINGTASSSTGTVTMGEINAQEALLEGLTAATGSFLDALIPAGSAVVTTSGTFTFLPLTTKNSDVGNNYNTSTGLYTVPFTGLYQIDTKLRFSDGTTPGISYGQGADVTAGDGSWCQWSVTTAATATGQTYSRQGSFNSRTVALTKGQQIGMYYYYNYAAGGVTISTAQMTIIYLRSSS